MILLSVVRELGSDAGWFGLRISGGCKGASGGKSHPGPDDWLLKWLHGACELVPCHLASLWCHSSVISALGLKGNRCLSTGMQEGFSEEATVESDFPRKKAFLPGGRDSFVG